MLFTYRSTLLGKVLRIDVNTRTGSLPYGIPSSNPYYGNHTYRQEIYAYGIRNIWRCDVDEGQSFKGNNYDMVTKPLA